MTERAWGMPVEFESVVTVSAAKQIAESLQQTKLAAYQEEMVKKAKVQ